MNRALVRLLLGLFFLFCFIEPAIADDDWQHWNVTTVKYQVTDRVNLLFNPELRFTEDITEFSFWRLRNGVGFKLNDHLSLGMNYLYARKKSASGEWVDEHGFENDIIAKGQIKRFAFQDRVRFEQRDLSEETKYRVRNQFKVSTDLEVFDTKIKVYVFDEIFYDMEDNQLNQNRAGVGFVKKINASLAIDISAWYRSDRTGDDWRAASIIRTNLVLTF